MRLVENSVEEYVQEPGINGIYKAITDAARICYQSTKITSESDNKAFCEKVLLAKGHTRPFEFGTVYLTVDSTLPCVEWFKRNKWSNVEVVLDKAFITTNMRVIMQGEYASDEVAFENDYNDNLLYLMDFLTEPSEYHAKRRTFNIIISRGCSDDLRTHISLSSICESSRYCNYSKNKFSNELTFIKPYWLDDIVTNEDGHLIACEPTSIPFLKCLEDAEYNYLKMSKIISEAQRLKRIYPLGAKVELRLCGFDDAWRNLFWRRCDSHADPECVIVANEIKKMW